MARRWSPAVVTVKVSDAGASVCGRQGPVPTPQFPWFASPLIGPPGANEALLSSYIKWNDGLEYVPNNEALQSTQGL